MVKIQTKEVINQTIYNLVRPHAEKLSKMFGYINELTEEERKEYILSQEAIKLYNKFVK